MWLEANLYHQDLHRNNLLVSVDKERRVQIIDFGQMQPVAARDLPALNKLHQYMMVEPRDRDRSIIIALRDIIKNTLIRKLDNRAFSPLEWMAADILNPTIRSAVSEQLHRLFQSSSKQAILSRYEPAIWRTTSDPTYVDRIDVEEQPTIVEQPDDIHDMSVIGTQPDSADNLSIPFSMSMGGGRRRPTKHRRPTRRRTKTTLYR